MAEKTTQKWAVDLAARHGLLREGILIGEITGLIEAAVAAERARCAKIARSHLPDIDDSFHRMTVAQTSRMIADAIERGE